MKQATVLIVCCFFLFGAVVLDNSGAHGSGFSTGVEIEMTAGEGSGGAAGAGTAGGNERSAAEMFWVILGVFLGGIALNLTPCIYPLIPVTISYFGGKSLSEQGRTGTSPIAAHALLYILGLSLTNSMLGVMAAMSGRLLGTVLQNPLTIILIAAILTIFAFSMFGFWELRLPAVITGAASKSYAGYFGSLFIGLTLGLVAAPCIGPFVVGLLVMVAKSGNPWFGFLLFFCLSLGMGLPLFILALLSERLRHLPKSGEWMLWVRRFMGWILLGMAAFFLRTIVPETVGVILLGSVILAAAIHLGWLDASSAGFRAFGWIRQGVGILGICIATVLVWSQFVQTGEGINWLPYSEQVMAEAKQSGKPIILDFSADWCSPCRQMERVTFHDPTVVAAAKKDFVTIRIDLTRGGDRMNESVSRRYNVRGVPTVLFLKPGGEERVDLRIQEFVGKNRFLARMREMTKT